MSSLKPGVLWCVNMYKREHLKLCPEIVVIFGDNMVRKGLGGQAKECRHEPNVLGIPVKWRPSHTFAGAYFSDEDLPKVGPYVEAGFEIARDTLLRGLDVAYPSSGIGSGRAQLESRAPKIMALVRTGEKMLQEAAYHTIMVNNLYIAATHKKLEEINGLRN